METTRALETEERGQEECADGLVSSHPTKVPGPQERAFSLRCAPGGGWAYQQVSLCDNQLDAVPSAQHRCALPRGIY